MRIPLLVVALVCTTAVAHAQPVTPYSARPLALVSASTAPPLTFVVPPSEPAYVPSTSTVDPTSESLDLARSGHRKKVTAVSLWAVGGALAVASIAVLADGAVSSDPGLCGGRCSPHDLVVSGAVGLAIGAAAAGAAVPLWLSGVADARRALRLRDRLSSAPATASSNSSASNSNTALSVGPTGVSLIF
jgi:hypothetical protein